MAEKNDDEIAAKLAEKHGISKDGVTTVLNALRSSGGTMAQFSHPDFGGMSQWSNGMTMVGDMFNNGLKAKLDALCHDLADYIRSQPAETRDTSSKPSDSGHRNWWPEGLGAAGATGAQNQMRYAVFPGSHRLVVDDGTRQTVYDTADHEIFGVAQSQSSGQTLSFTSQSGVVTLSDLDVATPAK